MKETAVTKDITKSALQIQTIGQLVKLSKGQNALLKLIQESVKNGAPLGWDVLVLCFYENVSKKISDWRYVSTDFKDRRREYFSHDLLEAYKNQTTQWQYFGRSRVRQWFVSTIGVLVVKGQLFILPSIELE